MNVSGSRRLTVFLLVLGGLAACDRKSPTDDLVGDNDSLEVSPRSVIEQLITLRGRAAYQQLNDLIVPERGRQVVALLMAVDGFLHANDALCEYVQLEFAVGLSQAIDQARWSHRLGVFSAHVKLIDERVEGDQATVSFMVNGRLPVRRAELRILDGRWRYDPGPGYDQRLVGAFGEMARGLRQVLIDLKEGRPAAADIQDDPELLVEEVRLRLSKGISLLPAPPSTQPAGDADSAQPTDEP